MTSTAQTVLAAAHDQFFATIEARGDVTAACSASGLSIDYALTKRRADPVFRERWVGAYDRYLETLRRISPTREVKVAHYLEVLAATGRVSEARKQSGMSANELSYLRRKDPVFTSRCDIAREKFADTLRKAAFDRGIDGVLEPKYHKGAERFQFERGPDGNILTDENGKPRIRLDENGQPVRLGVTRYSDAVLIALLKANCPEFKDTSRVELGNVPGETLAVTKDNDLDLARRIGFLLASGLRSQQEGGDNAVSDAFADDSSLDEWVEGDDDGSDLA